MDEKKSPTSNKHAAVIGVIVRVYLLEFTCRE
jgi:hypothetical protein